MTFREWIKQATRGLGEDSIARLLTELGDYYDSAHAVQIERGLSPEAAEQSVLAAMGDAKKANRQYRKVYLTRWEELHVKGGMNRDSLFPFLKLSPKQNKVAEILLIAFFILGFFWSFRSPALAFLYLFNSFVIWGARVFRVHTPARGRVFRFVNRTVLVLTCLDFYWLGLKSTKVWWAYLLTVPLYFAAECSRSSIRRKLPVDQWPKQLFE